MRVAGGPSRRRIGLSAWRPPPAWTPWGRIAFVAALVVGFAVIRAVIDGLSRQEVELPRAGADRRPAAGGCLREAAAALLPLLRRERQQLDHQPRHRATCRASRMFVDQVLIQSLTMASRSCAYAALHVLHPCAAHPGLPGHDAAALGGFLAVLATSSSPAIRKNRDLTDDMIQRLAENIRGIAVIKAFAREEDEIRKFRETNDVLRRAEAARLPRGQLLHAAHRFPEPGEPRRPAGLRRLPGHPGADPARRGADHFHRDAPAILRADRAISRRSPTRMQESLTGARRVFEVLDAPLEIVNAPEPMWLPRVWGRVTFEHVWFDPGHRARAQGYLLRGAAGPMRRGRGPDRLGQIGAALADPAFLRSHRRGGC